MRLRCQLPVLLLLALAAGAGAADAANTDPVPAVTVPRRQQAITIDGKPGDPGWSGAARIQLDRSPFGQDFSELWRERPTTVYLTYDGDGLYLAFDCKKPGPPFSFGTQRDDNLYRGDAVEVFLDAVGDHRQHYELQFNAAGQILDALFLYTGSGPIQPDADGLNTDWGNQWDCREYTMRNLRSAASVQPDGWYVEVAIPARELNRRTGGGPLRPGQRLVGNFLRIEHLGEGRSATANWSSTVPGRPHRSPGRMGELRLE